jgi:hypothetical protein
VLSAGCGLGVRRPDGSDGIYAVVDRPDLALVIPADGERLHLVFLATDLTPGTPQRDLEEQDMRSAWFTRGEVERMISDGTITDAQSAGAYALLLLTAAQR